MKIYHLILTVNGICLTSPLATYVSSGILPRDESLIACSCVFQVKQNTLLSLPLLIRARVLIIIPSMVNLLIMKSLLLPPHNEEEEEHDSHIQAYPI